MLESLSAPLFSSETLSVDEQGRILAQIRDLFVEHCNNNNNTPNKSTYLQHRVSKLQECMHADTKEEHDEHHDHDGEDIHYYDDDVEDGDDVHDHPDDVHTDDELQSQRMTPLQSLLQEVDDDMRQIENIGTVNSQPPPLPPPHMTDLHQQIELQHSHNTSHSSKDSNRSGTTTPTPTEHDIQHYFADMKDDEEEEETTTETTTATTLW